MENLNKNTNTVDEVVDGLIAELPLELRVSIANLDEAEFRTLELTREKYQRYKLDQLNVGVNEALRDDCIAKSSDETLDDVDAATVILKALWDRLRQTHRIRVVK